MSVKIKMLVWYVAAVLLGLIMLGFVMSAEPDASNIIINFMTLMVGLFTGLLIKERAIKKPWLLLFIPIVYFMMLLII